MADTNTACHLHSAGQYKGLDSQGYAIYQCWCGRTMHNDPASIRQLEYMDVKKRLGWREAYKAFPDMKGKP